MNKRFMAICMAIASASVWAETAKEVQTTVNLELQMKRSDVLKKFGAPVCKRAEMTGDKMETRSETWMYRDATLIFRDDVLIQFGPDPFRCAVVQTQTVSG